MKRPYGSGQIYEKSGSFYERWRTADGRRVNRRIGPKRTKGGSDGLTRAQAEQAFRRIQAEKAARRPVEPVVEIVTVDQAAERLRERIAIEGARLSYRQNCESMQRVHISPAMGKQKVAAVTTRDVERLASSILERGSSPKTVRNVMTFLFSVFALAVKQGWAPTNPVADAARPKRRRARDADPDLQFLTPPELDRVIDMIPDRDALGPVVRLIVLATGMTGLRQSELLGLRWRDVGMRAQRVRVRNAWVRYEHSGEGKSDLNDPLGADDRPADRRSEEVAAADRLRRRR
jgi:integrase